MGKSKATSLVKYQDNFGPFQSIEDLFQIKGFGLAFFDNLQEAGELAAAKKKTSIGLKDLNQSVKCCYATKKRQELYMHILLTKYKDCTGEISTLSLNN